MTKIQKSFKNVQIKSNAGRPIRSFGDWEKYALPPERKKMHWEEGRSACELGRIWTASGEPAVPGELTRLLESHEGTRGILFRTGITEHETRLPFTIGGPRCHDLALQGEQNGSPVTICIEAKADESFGGTVAKELLKAERGAEARRREQAKRRVKARRQARTMFPKRLDWLTRSLLGLPAFEDDKLIVISPAVAELPYQLLSAIGGTLIEADLQKARKAVLVIHEFRTVKTEDANLDANANALNRFLRLLLAANKADVRENFELESGQIIGPILITDRTIAGPVKIPNSVPLFIGKIRTDLLA
jgi:hypothetical protein